MPCAISVLCYCSKGFPSYESDGIALGYIDVVKVDHDGHTGEGSLVAEPAARHDDVVLA
jgi:hypothetical protein